MMAQNKYPKLNRHEMAATMTMPEETRYRFLLNNNWFPCYCVRWNWHDYSYRPAKPNGFRFTEEFRHVEQDEWYLDWKTGKAIQALVGKPHGRFWILKEL